MTRDEHIEWCKQRALEYVDGGDINNALASMLSDLTKHDETKNHSAITIGVMLAASGHLSTPHEMRRFIEGFH
jgi:hypothetical protein